MKQKRIVLLALAVLLVLLLGGLLLAENVSDPAGSEPGPGLDSLSTLTTGDVDGVTVQYQGTQLDFVKTGDSWTVKDDPDFPLDQTGIETMVTALCTQVPVQALGTVENPADYGLDVPQLTVTGRAGAAEQTFVFGAENQMADVIYLQVQGSPEVYAMPAQKAAPFRVTLEELRAPEPTPSPEVSDEASAETEAAGEPAALEADEKADSSAAPEESTESGGAEAEPSA